MRRSALTLAVVAAVAVGCIPMVDWSKHTRESLAMVKTLDGLNPAALHAVEEVCPTEGRIVYAQVRECQIAGRAATQFELARRAAVAAAASGDVVELGEGLFFAADALADVNAKVWSSAIDDNVRGRVPYDFNDALALVRRVGAKTGAPAAINAAAEKLTTAVQEDGRPEVTEYAVTVKEMVSLGLEPRGTLRSYRDAGADISSRFNRAKIRISMAKPKSDLDKATATQL